MRRTITPQKRTFAIAMVAVLIIGVSGGFYWSQSTKNQAGASNIATTTDTNTAAFLAAQARFAQDSDTAQGIASGGIPANFGVPSTPGSSPKPSPTQASVCLPPEYQDITNYPPDVDTKLTAAKAVGDQKAAAGSAKAANDFVINFANIFNTPSLPTVDFKASDSQILLALEKIFDPKEASVMDLVYGEINTSAADTNSAVYGKIDGPFHRLNDYFGGSSGTIGYYKPTDIAPVKYHYSYKPTSDGYAVSADVTVGAHASIGSLLVGVSAAYTWRGGCLVAIKDGTTTANWGFAPSADIEFTITSGKSSRQLRVSAKLQDPHGNLRQNPTLTFAYHGSF